MDQVRARLLAAVVLLLAASAPAAAQQRIAWTMARNPASGAVLPRLTAGQNRARVNRQLDSLAASLRCGREAAGRGRETYFRSRARVAYAARDVFSVAITASYDCAGPYPTDGANLSVTYDLRTGRAVPFEALFADYARDGAAIVRALFPDRAARAERPASAGDEEERACTEAYSADFLLQTGFAWSVSPRGLVVEPEFPHVVAACAREAVVPFARLRRFAAPGGILARLAGGS
jgi:hypothetical protein